MTKYFHLLIMSILLVSLFSVACTASASGGYSVKAYFTPISATNFDDTVAVNRTSPTLGVGTYAVEQVVAGPTLAERNQGLFSQLHDSINGPSTCGGSDFLLSISSGKATIKFCRLIASAGVGTDARITTEVSRTLLQFSSIQKVVILSKDGNCFGDESGQNMCLK